MTVAISITLLALMVGLNVLIRIEKEGLPKIYRYMALLFILMAFLYNMCLMTRGVMIHTKVRELPLEEKIKSNP